MSSGYTYLAIQYTNECRVGRDDQYNRGGSASGCSHTNNGYEAGGSWMNTVWKLGQGWSNAQISL
jgi:hypothetical protein